MKQLLSTSTNVCPHFKGLDPSTLDVPVVGGHAGVTILPLLSQCNPAPAGGFTEEEIARLTDRIQNGGTEVVEAKAGGGTCSTVCFTHFIRSHSMLNIEVHYTWLLHHSEAGS